MDVDMVEPTFSGFDFPVTISYMEKVMRDYLHDDTFTVKNLNSTKALNDGDNCIADVFRVIIDAEITKDDKVIGVTKSVIVKKPTNDKTNTPPEIFKFESSVYNNVLGTLEAAFGEKLPVIRCIKAHENIVITEDFQDDCWTLTNRREGMIEEECVQAIKSLAKFHAASVVLKTENAMSFIRLREYVQDQVYSDSTEDVCRKTLADAYEIAKYHADKYLPTANQEEALGIRNFFEYSSDEIYVSAKTATQDTPEFAKVLTHGNCWANNIMFQENEAGDHALLINLSTVCLTTPARDLVYLFASNPEPVDKTVLTYLYIEELHKHFKKHNMSRDVFNKFSIDFIQSEIERLEDVARLTALWLLVPLSYVSYPTVEEYNNTERKDKPELVSKHLDLDFYNRRLVEICLEYA